MIHSLNKGNMDLSKLPADLRSKLKKMAKSIKNKTVKQFASTKHKGLPNRVRKKKERNSRKNEALNQLIKILKKEVIRLQETDSTP